MSNADQLRDANPWHPITDPVDLKRLGKLAEELFECSAALAECIIIGVSDHEPSPRTCTRTWLEQEVADVQANVELVASRFSLDLRQSFNRWAGWRAFLDVGNDSEFIAACAKRFGDCGAAVSRCIIQGIDEREPVTGRINRDWLQDMVGGVLAAIGALVNRFELDLAAICARADKKKAHLSAWHRLA